MSDARPRPTKVQLLLGETPLQSLPRLAQRLGLARLYAKRDDMTGLAMGGNKARKLEYLVGRALADGADTLVTLGAYQSNHVRQTAAAAAVAGLSCAVLLLPTAYAANAAEAYRDSGNILLDRLLGAEIHFGERRDDVHGLVERLKAQGRRPFLIALGGSDGLGSIGYVDAFAETARQLAELGETPDHIVTASGSGGTQAGLIVGAALHHPAARIHGVDVASADAAVFAAEIDTIAAETASLLSTGAALQDAVLAEGFVGDAYGSPSDAMRESIALAARTEGLILDPVYTGKALAGLKALARSSAFGRDSTVVFLHTGGHPGLFAYRSQAVLG